MYNFLMLFIFKAAGTEAVNYFWLQLQICYGAAPAPSVFFKRLREAQEAKNMRLWLLSSAFNGRN